jgi:hypothetical protein
MQSSRRASLAAGLAGIVLALLVVAQVHGQEKPKSITFKTADGVTLSGTLYAAKKSKDGAVVLLLHDFDSKKGGSSAQGGWGALAKSLQDAGYHVLSFDFRGFGDSKEVNAETFWKHKHNLNASTKAINPNKPPETIDFKNFSRSYYPYLVNDIAAAKAYLDRANDRKEVNSSNLLIVGAGQGATLGAMWLANESYRRRDKNPKGQFAPQPNLADPEVQDVGGCVWLTPTQSIENRNVGGAIKTWLAVAGRTNKVPMAFYYGKNDKTGGNLAAEWVKAVKGIDAKISKDLNVAAVPIDGTNLTGSKLLDSSVNKKIIGHLDKMLDVRGSREQRDKKVEDNTYYYLIPPAKLPKTVPNKKAGEEVPPVDLNNLLK